jgi:hypothetical protein
MLPRFITPISVLLVSVCASYGGPVSSAIKDINEEALSQGLDISFVGAKWLESKSDLVKRKSAAGASFIDLPSSNGLTQIMDINGNVFSQKCGVLYAFQSVGGTERLLLISITFSGVVSKELFIQRQTSLERYVGKMPAPTGSNVDALESVKTFKRFSVMHLMCPGTASGTKELITISRN